jgi:hypothetical protein
MNTQSLVLLFAVLDLIMAIIAWTLLHPAMTLAPQVASVAPQPTREYSVGSRDVIYIEIKPGCVAEMREHRKEGYIALAEKEDNYVVMVRLNGKETGSWR